MNALVLVGLLILLAGLLLLAAWIGFSLLLSKGLLGFLGKVVEGWDDSGAK